MPYKSQILFLGRVLVVVAVVVGAKTLANLLSWQPISLNALFSGIIAGNVFLMGFLLSGVLSDYKESERIPGELGACLENMAQEVRGIGVAKPEAEIGPCLTQISKLGDDILRWFYKKIDTEQVVEGVNELTVQFDRLQPWTQGTFVGRLKQEQSNLRRTITRIDTVRETSFVSSAYLLADTTTLLLCTGLVLVKMDSFNESLFFAGIISFLLVFLLTLIRDLDNPFGYYERFSGADVSLRPFEDTVGRLKALAESDASAAKRS